MEIFEKKGKEAKWINNKTSQLVKNDRLDLGGPDGFLGQESRVETVEEKE